MERKWGKVFMWWRKRNISGKCSSSSSFLFILFPLSLHLSPLEISSVQKKLLLIEKERFASAAAGSTGQVIEAFTSLSPNPPDLLYYRLCTKKLSHQDKTSAHQMTSSNLHYGAISACGGLGLPSRRIQSRRRSLCTGCSRHYRRHNQVATNISVITTINVREDMSMHHHYHHHRKPVRRLSGSKEAPSRKETWGLSVNIFCQYLSANICKICLQSERSVNISGSKSRSLVCKEGVIFCAGRPHKVENRKLFLRLPCNTFTHRAL